MISVLSSRYAGALADVVMEPGAGQDPKQVLDQLRGVEDLIVESNELRHVLSSPALAASRKRRVISDLTPDLGLTPIVRNFLFVLIDHRRIAQIPEIREAFEAEVDRRRGVVRADITSAQPLSDAERNTVQARLASLTGHKVRMEYAVDPALVGGLVARIGSTVYDGSVRGQLDALRERLATS